MQVKYSIFFIKLHSLTMPNIDFSLIYYANKLDMHATVHQAMIRISCLRLVIVAWQLCIVFLKPFKFYILLSFICSAFLSQNCLPLYTILCFIGIKDCMQAQLSEFRFLTNQYTNATFNFLCRKIFFIHLCQYKFLFRRFRCFQKKFPLLAGMACIGRIGEDWGREV